MPQQDGCPFHRSTAPTADLQKLTTNDSVLPTKLCIWNKPDVLEEITQEQGSCDQVERLFPAQWSTAPTKALATLRSPPETGYGAGHDWRRSLPCESRTGDAALRRRGRSLRRVSTLWPIGRRRSDCARKPAISAHRKTEREHRGYNIPGGPEGRGSRTHRPAKKRGKGHTRCNVFSRRRVGRRRRRYA